MRGTSYTGSSQSCASAWLTGQSSNTWVRQPPAKLGRHVLLSISNLKPLFTIWKYLVVIFYKMKKNNWIILEIIFQYISHIYIEFQKSQLCLLKYSEFSGSFRKIDNMRFSLISSWSKPLGLMLALFFTGILTFEDLLI